MGCGGRSVHGVACGAAQGDQAPREGSLHSTLAGIHRRFIARCYRRGCPAVVPVPLQSDFCPTAAGFVLRSVQRRQARYKLEVVGVKGGARSSASSQNRNVELADIACSEAATLDVHGAYGTAATLRKGWAKLMRHKALLGALVG